MENGIYFYGVTFDKKLDNTTIEGISPEYNVFSIKTRDLIALVSKVNLKEYGHPAIDENIENIDWLTTKAEKHMEILKNIMNYSQIIPMKFCTIFYDGKKIHEIVEKNYDNLVQSLDYLTDKEEWSFKIYYNKKQFSHKYSEDSKRAINDNSISKGAAYFTKKKIDMQISEKADQEIYKIAEELFEKIKNIGIDSKKNKNLAKELTGRKDEMVLNMSILVDDEHKKKIVDFINTEIEKLKNQYIYIDYNGPWPPYDFIPCLNP